MRKEKLVLGAIWVIIIWFVILVFMLMGKETKIEKYEKGINGLKIEIEQLSWEESDILENMKTENTRRWELIKTREQKQKEKECMEQNLWNVIQWEDEVNCDIISQKKKTIVLKKK
jgi:hypothetical protein